MTKPFFSMAASGRNQSPPLRSPRPSGERGRNLTIVRLNREQLYAKIIRVKETSVAG